MCFLVAKDFYKTGSIALQVQGGADLLDIKRSIEKQVDIDRIQLVTISRPSVYGEYEPYRFAKYRESFEEMVLAM